MSVIHFGNFQSNSGNFQQNPFAQQQQPPRKPRKPRKAIGNAFTRTLLNLLITLLFAAGYYYVQLPALNLQSREFYVFLLLSCAVYCVCAVLTSGFQGQGPKEYGRFVKKQCKVPFFLALALIAVAIVGALSSWTVFRAKAYSKLLDVRTGNFADEVDEISYKQIPMLDKDSAERLGSRKLGELSDMVSQFEVLDQYTQINYKGRPVRVTSLRYGNFIKWITNHKGGLPAYLIIDMTTQNVQVVRLKDGMRYSTAEHFNHNLYRHLRFRYPTMMFDTPTFEIDDNGTPYWICSRVVRRIGLFGGTDIRGAVMVNAVTGASKYYKNVPEWVDRVYNANLIMKQYDDYGKYHNGYWNSVFGQRGVKVTTEGYNYLVIGDDVYMYTGVTSVTSDQSNVGFLLNNQRTKETRFYSCAGAKEISAKESAEGQVQQMKYKATFPLLLNIADQPTYFMSLKDAAGLVKMYAMVNVQQYQIVATGQTVAECEASYRTMLKNNNLIDDSKAEVAPTDEKTVTGTIAEIRSAVMDGNTYYFIRLNPTGGNTPGAIDSKIFYSVSAADNELAVILNVGDSVSVTYKTGKDSGILKGTKITYADGSGAVESTVKQKDTANTAQKAS